MLMDPFSLSRRSRCVHQISATIEYALAQSVELFRVRFLRLVSRDLGSQTLEPTILKMVHCKSQSLYLTVFFELSALPSLKQIIKVSERLRKAALYINDTTLRRRSQCTFRFIMKLNRPIKISLTQRRVTCRGRCLHQDLTSPASVSSFYWVG